MFTTSFVSLALIAGAISTLGINGVVADLFDCNDDQHAFAPAPGKFIVHYTSIRDSHFQGEPWIRICKPNGSRWTNVPPLVVPCNPNAPVTLDTRATTLKHALTVNNGNGCVQSGNGQNLVDAFIKYDGQKVNLQDGGSKCGPRDHGISCEFNLD